MCFLSVRPYFRLNREGRTILDLIGMEMNGPKYDRKWLDRAKVKTEKTFQIIPESVEKATIASLNLYYSVQ